MTSSGELKHDAAAHRAWKPDPASRPVFLRVGEQPIGEKIRVFIMGEQADDFVS